MNTESPDMVNGSGMSVGEQKAVPKKRRGRPRKYFSPDNENHTRVTLNDDDEIVTALKYAEDDSNFSAESKVHNIGSEDVETWYRRHSLCHRLFDKERTMELIKEFQGDDEKKSRKAMELLVKHNQRLIASVARKYRGRVAFMDLIQEGNLGLLRAIEDFDLKKGNYLSTYALWWINRRMIQAIEKTAYVVRVPCQAGSNLAKIWKLQSDFQISFGKPPTQSELFEMASQVMSKQSAVALIRLNRSPVYIDTALPVGDSSREFSYHDVLPDMKTVSPEEMAMARSELEFLENQVSLIIAAIEGLVAKGNMTETWKGVFYTHYGLCGHKYGLVLDQIGKMYGMKREMVRQITNYQAWTKLYRYSPESHKLPRKAKFEEGLRSIPILEDITGEQVTFVSYHRNGESPKSWRLRKSNSKSMKP